MRTARLVLVAGCLFFAAKTSTACGSSLTGETAAVGEKDLDRCIDVAFAYLHRHHLTLLPETSVMAQPERCPRSSWNERNKCIRVTLSSPAPPRSLEHGQYLDLVIDPASGEIQ